MRRSVIVTVGVCLAFFVCLSAAVSASSPSGEIVYRQNFTDVSSLTSAGVAEGTRNTASSEVTLSKGMLTMGDTLGDRTFALLPFYNCYSDYTVRFGFSFTEAVRQSGYVALMLTSRGDAPDNITSVKIRADGECEGFSSLSPRLVHALKKGEKINVTVPVSGGVLDRITVCADGISETLAIDNIVNVVEGTVGFCVRNVRVQISEIAVIEGVGYENETGIYTETSTWTDDMPYMSPAAFARGGVSLCSEPMVMAAEAEAPVTGDASVAVVAITLSALASSVLIFKRKRYA